MKVSVMELEKQYITISWNAVEGAQTYRIFWSDVKTTGMQYRLVGEEAGLSFTLRKGTHRKNYVYVEACKGETVLETSPVLEIPVFWKRAEQLERLNRGLVAVMSGNGVFLAWRMWKEEASGYCETGLIGTDYVVYKNGQRLGLVSDSTNYLDQEGTEQDAYQVAPFLNGQEGDLCAPVSAAMAKKGYVEIPMQVPAPGVTPAGQTYTYSANDMSVGDADGDGEYEFYVKWDPSNSHDVIHKGYTGNCYIDCYKLDGRLLWRLDMGPNIRSGAHYTQFMVYDFDGDGCAEMSVKTAPGTKITRYDEAGNIISEKYITISESDRKAGVTDTDNYVCTAADYYEHIVDVFMHWTEHKEVQAGHWPATLEECFGIEKRYEYPLSEKDARALTDYFMDVFAPSRSEKNELRKFEGYIFTGPEYLTMFSGDGEEIETIPFPVPREDDGLLWGDYVWNRIEPLNRVDRFLSGVAYLDGVRPYLIICRGYYTRTTVTAYDFFERKHHEYFKVDSGYVPMNNPFMGRDMGEGTDPVYGVLTGQGDHSLAVADVDGDGCQEIIYGAAVIDHDGSVLYSSRDRMPDDRLKKLGHGDSMHVARIDPDRPGFEIFNVFEGGKSVPYGYALRDAETGRVLFGEKAEGDLGRCMIGDVVPGVRGLQVWVKGVRDCKGAFLDVKTPGTNANIKWAADLSTQIVDAVPDQNGERTPVISDLTHGVMLTDEETATNNGTKGNPCLIADVFGDFREEILLRTRDSSAIRIYVNTEITEHKLFTLMHDTMYRCGVAWQNNCYNQPCYTSFYYASDMDFENVL
ncbi:MAG: rhamnogalacturonan lyase [Lachnospiraceae bacterium]|nr:rhamnogalacturonan lyase [Lachnospiraceae bacterium]